MLTHDRIKPYLLHQDRYLRNAAIDYLYDSWSRDPDLIPMVLEMWDRFPQDDPLHALSCCRRFRLTEEALEPLLRRLAVTPEANPLIHLNQILAHAPVALFSAAEQRIYDAANVTVATTQRLERRRELNHRSGEALWQELQDFSARSSDKPYVSDIDYSYADDLVEALAPYPVPDDATICTLLAESFKQEVLEDNEKSAGWLELFLVDLCGERRVRAALPILAQGFDIDADFLPMRVSDALIKIGDPDAIRLLRERYAGSKDYSRLFMSAAFGNFKHPDSEEAVLALLPEEKDRGNQTFLCDDLCKLFSERGIEVVRRQIERGYDRDILSLEEDLLPVLEVLGISLPEAETWRKERAENELRVQRRRAELAELGKRASAAEKRAHPSPPVAEQSRPYSKPAPLQRDQARIGRNDPCPCGSGKKYKKCCGRPR